MPGAGDRLRPALHRRNTAEAAHRPLDRRHRRQARPLKSCWSSTGCANGAGRGAPGGSRRGWAGRAGPPGGRPRALRGGVHLAARHGRPAAAVRPRRRGGRDGGERRPVAGRHLADARALLPPGELQPAGGGAVRGVPVRPGRRRAPGTAARDHRPPGPSRRRPVLGDRLLADRQEPVRTHLPPRSPPTAACPPARLPPRRCVAGRAVLEWRVAPRRSAHGGRAIGGGRPPDEESV